MDPDDSKALLEHTINFDAPRGTGDSAVLHKAQIWYLKEYLGSVDVPVAPNLDEQRKMLPILEGFAKAMILCAAGDGELADGEREYVLGFCATCGATFELLEELRALDHRDLDPQQLMAMTERPGLFTHSLIYHSIKAADGDGVLDDREVMTIKAMSAVLGVTSEAVDELVTLHREEQALMRKKMALLFPDGHPWA